MIDNFYYNSAFSFLTAFIITYLSIPSIITVAKLKHLFDVPNPRKLHTGNIPTLGGLGIFLGFSFSMTLWTDFQDCMHLQYVVTSLIIIAVIGIKDDIIGLSPLKKALGQVLASVIIVIWGDLKISNMYHIFGVTDLPEHVSIVFTIFTILVIINAFNFIDGIDWLAGSIGLIASLAFGVFFLVNPDNNKQAILAFALAGALISFLRFNYTPAKIFMGDTGSMMVGFIMAYLSIEFLETPNKGEFIVARYSVRPLLTMSVLFVPLFDLIRVFSIRIWHGRSPFKPDQNHLHHMLLKLGFTHLQSTLIISVLALFLIFLAIALQKFGNYWIGFILLSACLIFTFILFTIIKKRGITHINGK